MSVILAYLYLCHITSFNNLFEFIIGLNTRGLVVIQVSAEVPKEFTSVLL